MVKIYLFPDNWRNSLAFEGFVTHTVIPETIRFPKLYRKGAYINMFSFAFGFHGSLLFLGENEKGSSIYKASLHNPVQDIQKVTEGVQGTRICY